MNRLLLIMLVLCCLALASPPPVPKRVKHVKPPTKGDGAALLIKPKVLPPPPFVWLELDWDYPGPLDGITFNLYQRQPSTSWAMLAQVRGATHYQFPVSSGPNSVFFTVTAINMATGYESQTP